MDKKLTQEEFLSMILPAPTAEERIEIRGIAEGHKPWREWAKTPAEAVALIAQVPSPLNIYFGLGLRNGREGTSAATTRIKVVVVDMDFDAYSDGEAGARRVLNAFPVKPSMVVQSGNGWHVYWEINNCEKHLFPRVQAVGKKLAIALKGDLRELDPIGDAARVLRPIGTLNYKYDPPKPVTLHRYWPRRKYYLPELEEKLPARRGGVEDGPDIKEYTRITQSEEIIPVGNRRNVLISWIGWRRSQGASADEIATELAELNSTRCEAPLTDANLAEMLKSADKWPQPATPRLTSRPAKPVFDETALHGLAGDIVRTLEPHTEASPVALLAHILAFFGNIVGSKAYFLTDADRQTGQLFVVVVGPTSKGRKGTALSQVRTVFKYALDEWEERLAFGVSTGEGLIKRLHDDIKSWKSEKKDRKGHVTPGEWVLTEPAVEDKRLIAVLGEFSQMLTVMARPGNTLSSIVRQAWDGVPLEIMTKVDPMKATATHVTLIGHGVPEEILQTMDKTEFASGFGNRFIWIWTERSKLLPHGGRVDGEKIVALGKRVREAVENARHREIMFFNPEAYQLWGTEEKPGIYHQLSRDCPGMAGAMLARAEPQVIRLALIYALLDGAKEIKAAHLRAALALWQYAEQSITYIFGDALGYPLADRIFQAVREAGELTGTQIYRDVLQGNVEGPAMNRALDYLLEHRRLNYEEKKTAGRPVTIYRPYALNALNAQSLEEIDEP